MELYAVLGQRPNTDCITAAMVRRMVRSVAFSQNSMTTLSWLLVNATLSTIFGVGLISFNCVARYSTGTQ